MSATNFLEKDIADRIFGRSTSYSIPNTLYFGLLLALPNEDGLNGQEVSSDNGSGYGRVAIANTSTNFDPTPSADAAPALRGVKANKLQIAWGASATPWGRVVGIGVFDAATDGNLLAYFELTQDRDVGVADTMRIEPHEFRLSFHDIGGPDYSSPFSALMQRHILDWYFGDNSAYVIPSTLHAALMTTMPDDSDAGGVELTIGNDGYARAEINNNSAMFPGYGSDVTENAQQISWPTATAEWSSVVGVCIYDAASAGNLLFKAPFGSSRDFPAGETPRIATQHFGLVLD